jgi:hypothetical protein
MNPIEAVFDRIAKSVAAGVYTLEAGVNEAERTIGDLFSGKPHGYDVDKIYDEVTNRLSQK